jgi:hypothetical protein
MNMTVNVTQTSPHPVEEIKFDQFETELRKLIDSLSMEKYCKLPDHIIAKYLRNSFENLANTQSTGPEYFRI